MKPADNPEQFVPRLRYKARREMRDRVLSDILEIFEKSKKTKPAFIRPNIWRIIMKSSITKLAAAAVIIIAVFLGMSYLVGPVGVTSVALAQVKEAIEKVNWMHLINREEGQASEAWLSFESKIRVKKGVNGQITYTKYGENKQYVYRPDTETIYVSEVTGERFAFGTAGPIALFEQLLEMEQDKGAKVTRRRGEIWEVTKSERNVVIKARLLIDVEDRLPIAMELKTMQHGKVVQDTNVKFEYPEKGPKDIYELGVPRSAAVVDGEPPHFNSTDR